MLFFLKQCIPKREQVGVFDTINLTLVSGDVVIQISYEQIVRILLKRAQRLTQDMRAYSWKVNALEVREREGETHKEVHRFNECPDSLKRSFAMLFREIDRILHTDDSFYLFYQFKNTFKVIDEALNQYKEGVVPLLPERGVQISEWISEELSRIINENNSLVPLKGTLCSLFELEKFLLKYNYDGGAGVTIRPSSHLSGMFEKCREALRDAINEDDLFFLKKWHMEVSCHDLVKKWIEGNLPKTYWGALGEIRFLILGIDHLIFEKRKIIR